MNSIADTTQNRQPSSKSCYFYILPWIQIKKPVRLNQLTLHPWPSEIIDEELKGYSAPTYAAFRNTMKCFKDIRGKSISSVTIVRCAEGPLINENDRNSDQLINSLHLALRLLHYRYNDYNYQKNWYLQYQMFQFRFNETDPKILIASSNWFNTCWEDVPESIYMPENLIQSDILFPVRRLREVLQSVQNPNPNLFQCIKMALNMMDISYQQSSQMDLNLSLFLLCSIFNYLFGGPFAHNEDALAFHIEDFWTFPFRDYEYHPSIFKNKQIKQVTRVQSFRVVKQPSSKKTWLQAWLLELFRMKNEMSAGNPIHPKEYAWTIVQHLRIATEIIPLTIIIMLSKDPNALLPLKNEDEKRIKNVDAFIQYAKAKWYGAGYPHPNQPEWLQGKTQPNLWDSLPEK